MRPPVEPLEKGIPLLADWEEPLMAAFRRAGDQEFDAFLHDREVIFEGVTLALTDSDLSALRWLAVVGFDLIYNGPSRGPADSRCVCAVPLFLRAMRLAGIADADVIAAYEALYYAAPERGFSIPPRLIAKLIF